jgi:hypothetical protein
LGDRSASPDLEGRQAPHLDSTIFGKFDGDVILWPAGDVNGTSSAKGTAAAADIERAAFPQCGASWRRARHIHRHHRQ